MGERPSRVTRRQAMDQLGRLALFAGLTAATHNLTDFVTQPIEPQDTAAVRFKSSQLGTAMNIRNIQGLGVRPESILELPYQRARVPIPFDYVSPQKPGRYNWEITDHVMDLACQAGKAIELQIGAKTIGWPEVNVPRWFLDEFSYLDPGKIEGYPWPKKPIVIDEDPKAREYILDYVEASAKRYLTGRWAPFIRTLFIENEAFSQNLDVSGRRYISGEFYEQERGLVKSYDREERDVVQNPPFDTPSAILYAITHADITGFNYYNNIGDNWLVRRLRWVGVQITAEVARSYGRQVRFTEYPGGPWVVEKNGRLEAVYPFYWSRFFDGLDNIHDDIHPEEGVYIWGPEVTFATGNKNAIRNLFAIVGKN